jgi:Ser/Thr protein kinase RdoA (MazF antagonist)
VPSANPPPADALTWALAALGPGTRLVAVVDLPQQRATGPWLLDVAAPTGTTTRVVLHLGGPDATTQFRTEVAALTVAERHGLAAPRVLAIDLDGPRLALVQSAIAGSSDIPTEPPLERSSEFGRAIAAIHAVDATTIDTPDLPPRTRSLDGFDFDALPVPAHDADLFGRVRAVTDDRSVPPAPTVLVHGDLWQGNTLWTGPTVHAGTIDWDFAGTGHPAIDLGTTRFDAALFHGAGHAEALLQGWREAATTAPVDDATVALGDLLAVRCSPPDLREWLPNFHAQGRTDLDVATVTDRRARFVEQALRNVDK